MFQKVLKAKDKLKFFLLRKGEWLRKGIVTFGDKVLNPLHQYFLFWKDIMYGLQKSNNVERLHILSSAITVLLGYGSFSIFSIYGMSFNYPISYIFYCSSILLLLIFITTYVIISCVLFTMKISVLKMMSIFVLLTFLVLSLLIFFSFSMVLNLPEKIGDRIIDNMENKF